MESCCTRFTVAEGGARLAATAGVKNTLAVEYSSFISTRLIHEDAYKIRGPLSSGRQRSVYVTRPTRVPVAAYDLAILTDLAVAKAVLCEDVEDWGQELEKKEVLVCTSAVFHHVLESGVLAMGGVNVLVIDSCHLVCEDESLQYIMKLYKQSDEDKRPRILALTYPLFNSSKVDAEEEEEIEDSPETKIDRLPTLEEKDESEETDSKESDTICSLDSMEPKMLEESIDKEDESLSEEEKPVMTRKKEVEFEEVGVYENLDDFEMYEKLEWKIEGMEQELCCQMDLAEDIDGGKRLSSSSAKPRELIIEYCAGVSTLLPPAVELLNYMRDTVRDAQQFIDEHRYDPTEIYGEDLYDEFMNIPDPTIDPTYIFKQFLYVLDELGPYAADKAAFSLLTKLEKLKIKVPYERHFLLLCLCTTVFVKIRCYADLVFSKYESDWDKIRTFSTPKVMRFAEILEKFQPPETGKEGANNDAGDGSNNKKNSGKSKANSVAGNNREARNRCNSVTDKDSAKNSNKNDEKLEGSQTEPTTTINKMLEAIDRCDFASLANKIEDKVNVYETNLKEILDPVTQTASNEVNDSESANDRSITEDGDASSSKTPTETIANKKEDTKVVNSGNSAVEKVDSRLPGFTRRSGHRPRGRGRMQRHTTARVQQQMQNPDALCGIVFMRESLMAKIMFMVIVDMSRALPSLSYLSAQYCAADAAGDAARSAKQQEDVLKKFRMHECNLLLATSALEEGIDLPRCNLVLRWDLPPSYRSYGLCRGRARALRAAAAVLSGAADGDALLTNVAVYREIDQIITRKCGCGIQDEPPPSEEDHADTFTHLVKPYTPSETNDPSEVLRSSDVAKVNDSTSTVNFNDSVNSVNNDSVQVDYGDNETKNVVNENHISSEISSKLGSLNSSLDGTNVDDSFNESAGSGKTVCDSNVGSECDRNKLDDRCTVGVSVSGHVSEIRNDATKTDGEIASVDMSTAIALINRYCAKLPSDTFTRLAPQWWMEEVLLPARGSTERRKAYVCTLRLPLNCPVKYNIVGHPMPSALLARRAAALAACRVLHRSAELDQHLMPIGKENFKASEGEAAGDDGEDSDCARPGTTKRRQYYYKRTAWAFTDCQPIIDSTDEEIEANPGGSGPGAQPYTPKEVPQGSKRNLLYAVASQLWCALPERYNTRGRRLHRPQHAAQAIGLLMARTDRENLQIPAFPVYTRSGEVRVSVRLAADADARLSPRRDQLIRRFMRFVFAEVLRVRRRGMRLRPSAAAENNYYIVPTNNLTLEDGTSKVDVDWAFLELIYQHTEEKTLAELGRPLPSQCADDDDDDDSGTDSKADPKEEIEPEKRERDRKVKDVENPLLKTGEVFVFDADKYKEAVVTPWYRNQDQPQFFLVAEICWNLSPDSAFPSASHSSFREYYRAKYGASLTQRRQPLLDVDHTSARLNLLTPRYVNRKGVALPVSSERTRRAKRDRLDQKQILVPELCRVHPFAAPLWFATVALPCVLYRINALLIADEIRRAVAIDVGLGIPKIDATRCEGFEWPPLDFGWSLAEVLSADNEKNEKKKEEDAKKEEEELKELEDTKENAKDSEEDAAEVEETTVKTLNDIMQEKEADTGFEIGTWSNDMASSIPTEDCDEYMEPLPPNLTFCTSASGGTNWCDPIEKPKNQYNPSRNYSMADSDCSYMSSDFDTDDSDLNSEGSNEDTDTSGFCCSKNSNAAMGVRIEYKTAREAEAVDLERRSSRPAPRDCPRADAADRKKARLRMAEGDAPEEYIEKFRNAVAEQKRQILEKGHLIHENEPIVDILPEPTRETQEKSLKTDKELEDIASKLTKINFQVTDKNRELFNEIFPYGNTDVELENGQITIETMERNKRVLLAELKQSLPEEEIKKMNCFSMVDVDIDSPDYVNEKVVNVGFDTKGSYVDKINKWVDAKEFQPYYQDSKGQKEFDFDYQPELEGHPGPSPSVILQALTMSNANDGINLERLETIGDSFLKFAITAYLYCAHPTVHEGKLSHMRSKQVSNLNLYRLGRGKRLGARMIASKFEPHDNWLPPCHRAPRQQEQRTDEPQDASQTPDGPLDSTGCFIPYNLITQHSIPDKSIADCVEALIGAYLLECGPRGALLFMSWLGIRVLPRHDLPLTDDHPYVKAAGTRADRDEDLPPLTPSPLPRPCSPESDISSPEDPPRRVDPPPEVDWSWPGRPVGSLRPYRREDGGWMQPIFGELKAPPSPLLRYIEDPEGELDQMLSGYESLERTLQYRFRDRSLLLQALTHASHHRNRLTDCYQRLEFLGDAILDYLITRHLYEDGRRHSPGALTDLRSALVNNTIFATLAARHGFHKYFRHMSPGLNEVLTKYVKIQEENGHSISEEHYLIQEDAMEQAEDVEVPKALGDLFESIAGAIFLDSGMSLGAVWRSYVSLMGAELEAFSAAAPKSPVRELLEAEPDTAKFGKPERLADGRRVRVCVEVFGRGAFKGIGRNYRIAKGTAARCALRHLRIHKR